MGLRSQQVLSRSSRILSRRVTGKMMRIKKALIVRFMWERLRSLLEPNLMKRPGKF